MIESYKCLDKQVYCCGEYRIVPIRFEDRFDIMRWRNDQIFHLRQKEPLTEDQQETYFNTIIKNIFSDNAPTQILFSYLKGDDCIGYGGLVHINWNDKNAEISFLIDSDISSSFFETHWLNFLNMIDQVAFGSLHFKKIFTYAFDLRSYLYPILEKHGMVLEARLKDHAKCDRKFVDVLIHSKFNSTLNAEL